MQTMASAVWTQARPSRDQQQRCDSPSGPGFWCRCVLAAAGWLQGVRRLFAACRFGSSQPGWTLGFCRCYVVRNALGTVLV